MGKREDFYERKSNGSFKIAYSPKFKLILTAYIISASWKLIKSLKFRHAFIRQGGHDALRSLRLNYWVLPSVIITKDINTDCNVWVKSLLTKKPPRADQ